MPAPTLSQFQYLRGFVDAILVWLTEQDAAEATARANAVTAEATARADADSALQTQIDSKASSAHTHAQSEVTGLTAALDDKASASHGHAAGDITSGSLAPARLGTGTPGAGQYVDGGTGAWTSLPASPDLSGYAPLNSPALTGTPTAPTTAAGDDSTRIQTTAAGMRTERYIFQQLLDTQGLVSATDDADAATKSVPVGRLYYDGTGVVRRRMA